MSVETLDLRVAPDAHRTLHQLRGPHCFTVEVPAIGRWWLTLSTRQPSTSPAFLVVSEQEPDPRAVARFEAILFAFEEPGERVVCSTSIAALGDVEIGLTAAANPSNVDLDPLIPDRDPTVKGDSLEVEVDPDPLSGTATVKGNPLDVEIDSDL